MDEYTQKTERGFIVTAALFVVGSILFLFVGMQLAVLWKSKRSKGKKLGDLKGSLGNAVAHGEKVLAYFYSPSCAACKMQTRIVENLQRESRNVFKINVADDLDTARAFGVMATPTTAIVSRGIIEELFIGTKSEEELRKLL